MNALKRKDREEEVIRQQRIQEYERQLVLQKIKEDDEKTKKVYEEKEKLIEARQEIKRQMEKKKERLMKEFVSIKTKSNGASVNSETAFHSNSITRVANSEAYTPRLSTSNKPKKKKFKTRAKTSDRSDYTSSLNEPVSLDPSPKKSSYRQSNQERAQSEIENLKKRHNVELRQRLEIEQDKERERGQILDAIADDKERKRLDKIFGVERAKASQALMEIIKRFEHEVENTKKKSEI